MSSFKEFLSNLTETDLTNVSDAIVIAMAFVVALLIVASIFAVIISIYLAISYVKYNRTQNSCGKTGEEVARSILDANGLGHIKVSKNGSFLFGNSYSHYFKKVRLRRLIWKKTSVTSLAMASQKSSLAVLDKEGDPDMKARIRMTPFIYFGPLAFIPLILIGLAIDIFILKVVTGIGIIVCTALGFAIYLASFLLSIKELKTEKKAQQRALALLREDGLATDEELEMCEQLFRLYNIEYINNMIVALLELIYRILQIVANVQNISSSSKD